MRENKSKNIRANEMKVLFKGIRDANAKRVKRAVARAAREQSGSSTSSEA